MALQPTNFSTQDRLSPGAHGEKFIEKLPGYRNDEQRINRTNNNLNVSAHDVPNIKYDFDDRLPVLFRYGFAYGYNQMCVPKGRIAAIDPHMDLIDWESKKQFNTATLANGGAPVRLRTVADKYPKSVKGGLISSVGSEQAVKNPALEWAPIMGVSKAYATDCYRPFVDNTAAVTEGQSAVFVSEAKQLTKAVNGEAEYAIDIDKTGRMKKAGVVTNEARIGNIPVGMFQRNEYSRDLDAYNGMACGPILTDAIVELPYFAYKDKAESNVWGSAYGTLVPGDLVKSDENGRFVKSPLSSDAALATMTIAEQEKERQQVIGQIYAVNSNMVPEGAAKWATWALEDRLNYEGFNPSEWKSTNRKGEDSIARSPHNSTGEYPGYPYDKAFTEHDLHMLSSSQADNFNDRMNAEYQYSDLGIPGLTDGYNAFVKEFPAEKAGTVNLRDKNVEYTPIHTRLSNVNVDSGSVKIAIVAKDAVPQDSDFTPLVQGNVYKEAFTVDYFDALQGIVVLKVSDNTSADTLLATSQDIYFKYSKRGLAGVPTFMDWDGCVGSVKILLQK